MPPDASLVTSLLKTWRDTFDPMVGSLLESFATAQASPLEDLPLKKTERAARLAHLAKTSDAEGRSAVLLAFESFARDASGALVWPAVEAWAEVEEDPRVARMALRTLVALEHHLTGKLWRRLVGCVERHGDPGVAKDAEPYLATLEKKGGGWGFSVARFSNVLRKISSRRRGTLSAEALRKFELVAQRSKPAVNDDAAEDERLLGLILAKPEDDGLRAVYADWLLERRRPRGEFISLQLNRAKAKAPQKKREAQLLASHRAALLGPFDGVVGAAGIKFERGFLVEAVAVTPLPVTPLTRLLRSVKFKREVGEGVELSSLTHASLRDEFVEHLLEVAPALEQVTVELDFYGQPSFKKLRFPQTLRSFTVSDQRASFALSQAPDGWLLDLQVEHSDPTRATRIAQALLAATGVEPSTTVRCKRSQRKLFEPTLGVALQKRSRSLAWRTT